MRIRWVVIVGIVLGAVVGLAASYPRVLRRRCLTWGVSEQDAGAELPGDELLDGPDVVTTRGVDVDAAPDDVWPWLVQMGSGRGGAYTYDWIENLFGLDMHSADRILPEYQDLKVGDSLPVGEKGPRLGVEILDPGRALVVRSDDGNWVWSFVLRERGDGTQLISRNRIRLADMPTHKRYAYLGVMEPGSLLMERKMLLGIKSRAERGDNDDNDDNGEEAAD